MKFSILLFVIVSSFAFAATPSNDDMSIYQLNIELEDQYGKKIKLDTFRGQPVLIGMFYASCPHVCPLTIHNIQRTENALGDALQKDLRVLLVSLEPERDTPELLQHVAKRQNIDLSRWKLVRANTNGVRKLAAVLGVRFRKLPDGEINHTARVTLLNAKGKIISASELLTQLDERFVEDIQFVLQDAGTTESATSVH